MTLAHGFRLPLVVLPAEQEEAAQLRAIGAVAICAGSAGWYTRTPRSHSRPASWMRNTSSDSVISRSGRLVSVTEAATHCSRDGLGSGAQYLT
jgi:hypothetical protein